MTTIEERREIAAKLRSRSDDEEFHSENPMARGVHLLIAICESVFHDRRAREMASEQDMLNRLADLIEPGCRLEEVGRVCGHVIPDGWSECPRCRSKVVRDDNR